METKNGVPQTGQSKRSPDNKLSKGKVPVEIWKGSKWEPQLPTSVHPLRYVQKVLPAEAVPEIVACVKFSNYKRSISDEERALWRGTPEECFWRTQVFERDQYTCQKCGAKAEILNAHHIESFRHNTSLRYMISNGITFCKVCHKKYHKQYGQKSTWQKLSMFLKGEHEC